MKKLKTAGAALAVAAALVVGGTVAAAPANAVSSFVHTTACGAGKSVQINWRSSGRVDLWKFQGNTSPWSPTLVRSTTTSGSFSWNSGQSTVTWGFGNSTGTLYSYTATCVSFF